MRFWIDIFQWKKIEKDSENFWLRKLTLNVKFWHFLTPPQKESWKYGSVSYLFSCNFEYYLYIIFIVILSKKVNSYQR